MADTLCGCMEGPCLADTLYGGPPAWQTPSMEGPLRGSNPVWRAPCVADTLYGEELLPSNPPFGEAEKFFDPTTRRMFVEGTSN